MMPSACQEAIIAEKPSSIFALFSGGHDSLCSTHIASRDPRFRGVVHCNTGIGIEQTREFVRETCEDNDWFLYELHPERTYRDLVLSDYLGGFPGGPKSHMRYYYYLKARQIDQHVQRFKTHRKDRIGLVTGIRKAESTRRMVGAFAESVHREGAQLFLNPILDWTNEDKDDYMEQWGLRRNEVVDVLHRSGECLCGAFTSRGEFSLIETFYPDFAAEIKALEAGAAEAGIEDCYWGRRGKRENPDQLYMPLCSDCVAS